MGQKQFYCNYGLPMISIILDMADIHQDKK